MRHACQATNQSSHGELSFHHNPHLRLCWGLRLYTSRVIRSGGARLKHAAHFTYCHCCELCALKQKPGALLENVVCIPLAGGVTAENSKSQLQPVLITASGPQALNALAHRERYTQGSRQNRCVSLREALALRAKARGSDGCAPVRDAVGGSGLASFSQQCTVHGVALSWGGGNLTPSWQTN
jgi:hypothetical protein